MKMLVCLLVLLGLGFKSPGLPPVSPPDPTAEVGRLLSSAQAKLMALHAFQADLVVTTNRIQTPDKGPFPDKGTVAINGNITYLYEYPVDRNGKSIKGVTGLHIFSSNKLEVWVNTERYSHPATSVQGAFWFMFAPSVAGRVARGASPSTMFTRALERGDLTGVRDLGLQTWDGARYQVVQFQYNSQKAGGVPIFDWNVTVTQTDFIGADGLIHRTVQQDEKWRQDSKLLHVLVNKPVPDSIFVLPKDVLGFQKHGKEHS